MSDKIEQISQSFAKGQIRLLLVMYLKESSDIQQKFLPDLLGGDAYRAAMLACRDKFTDEILELLS